MKNYLLILFLFCAFNNVKAIESKIIHNIGNEIITNIDIKREFKYLIALNNSLKELDKKSETLKIVQQLRNEAHRFGIEHHRNKRSKTALNTELETISGVGEKTVIELLRHFKSAKRVANAKLDELEAVVGVSRAEKVYNYYHKT